MKDDMWWIKKLVGNLERGRYGKKNGDNVGVKELNFLEGEKETSECHLACDEFRLVASVTYPFTFVRTFFCASQSSTDNYMCLVCVW